MQDKIIVKGARANNLKNIDVTIPRDKLVVMTGLSGSGKSSLAFDTIYAEGQRSLYRTPPRPSGGHRKPAGTISRQLPYSNFARTCRVATKSVFSLTPGAARSLFGADKKRMGGASPVETAPWREPVSPGG